MKIEGYEYAIDNLMSDLTSDEFKLLMLIARKGIKLESLSLSDEVCADLAKQTGLTSDEAYLALLGLPKKISQL